MTGVWWEIPPPHLAGMVGLFKLSFEHKFVRTQNCCRMDLWLAWWFSPIIIISNNSLFINLIERVSWLLFRLSLCLFLVKFPWPPRVASNSHLNILSLAYENVALELASADADQRPAWLSQKSSDLSGLKPDSLLLPITRTSLTAWSPWEPSHRVDLIKVIPLGFVQCVPWALSRTSQLIPATLVIIFN
jgi:hypothetical protein